jgi:membrane protein implicated in regulation of membrane protease activity
MRLRSRNLTRLALTTLFCAVSAPVFAAPVAERLAQASNDTTNTTTLQSDDSDVVTGRLTSVNGSVARIEQDNGDVEYVNLPTRREYQQFQSFLGDRVTVRGRDGGTITIARAPQVVVTEPIASTPSNQGTSQTETIQPTQNSTTQTQTETQTQTTQTQPIEADPAETAPAQVQPDNTQQIEAQPQTTQPTETTEPVRGLW